LDRAAQSARFFITKGLWGEAMIEASNMPVTLEKARLNVWNLAGFILGIAVTAFGWGITYNSMTNANAAAVQEISELAEDVDNIRQQIAPISQLQFQVTRHTEQISETRSTSEAANKAMNERVDRLVETFGGKIDLMTDSVNKLVTRVEVLSSRIGSGSASAERTRFTPKT